LLIGLDILLEDASVDFTRRGGLRGFGLRRVDLWRGCLSYRLADWRLGLLFESACVYFSGSCWLHLGYRFGLRRSGFLPSWLSDWLADWWCGFRSLDILLKHTRVHFPRSSGFNLNWFGLNDRGGFGRDRLSHGFRGLLSLDVLLKDIRIYLAWPRCGSWSCFGRSSGGGGCLGWLRCGLGTEDTRCC